MARNPELEHLYDTFAHFVERCIVNNGSILLPDRDVWTPSNVENLKRRLVDHPLLGGDLDFEQKLSLQMKDAAPQEWLLLAELHYIYYLPPRQIRADTKITVVRDLAQRGGIPVPEKSDPIWDPFVKGGMSKSGIYYNRRYAQLWVIVLFANEIKNINHSVDLKDHKQVRQVLDNILAAIEARDRAYDMRHAILHMMFPDFYEQMISSRDKESIIKAFATRIDGDLPENTDDALLAIRQQLAPEFDLDGEPFNFYLSPLVSQWRSSNSGASVKSISTDTVSPKGTPILNKNIPESASPILATLKRTRNVILQGPPGTGKTYIARKIALALIEQQTERPLDDEARVQQAIEGLTVYDILALAMYHKNPTGKFSVKELLHSISMQIRYQTSPVKNPEQNIWGNLQSHTAWESISVRVSTRHEPFLFDKDSDSRWYLTDNGRAYVEQSLSENLDLLRAGKKPVESPDRFIRTITFHQSYSYEDFVEGWRPVSNMDAEGDILYEVVEGTLLQVASRARSDPHNKYVLIIDEINRGNVSKILGELITLLEDDKRSGQPEEIVITLPYSRKPFSLPANIYIIGTMNTADRSIALLDVALRRRFAFHEILPDSTLLSGILVSSETDAVDLGKLLDAINQRITLEIGRDYQIGHSYFLRVKHQSEDDRLDEMEYVWNNQVLPLLEEYFYGRREILHDMLRPFIVSTDTGEITDIQRFYGEDLILALSEVAAKR